MSGGIIPNWNSQCILPPCELSNPVSRRRSPYTVSLMDLIQRFGTSTERINILDGLLSFRSALHSIGLVKGFQWLDGSFSEDIESLQSRPPNDIDVVTFFYSPPGQTEDALLADHTQLFDQDYIWGKYQVDAYFVGLPSGDPEDNELENLVIDSAYWYGVWSHQRNTFLCRLSLNSLNTDIMV